MRDGAHLELQGGFGGGALLAEPHSPCALGWLSNCAQAASVLCPESWMKGKNKPPQKKIMEF